MADRKNPYVHPDESKGMLNQASSDGWSFDEYDDDVHPTPKIVLPGERPPDALSHEDRARMADAAFSGIMETDEGREAELGS